jgi:hypothetical protein
MARRHQAADHRSHPYQVESDTGESDTGENDDAVPSPTTTQSGTDYPHSYTFDRADPIEIDNPIGPTT